MSASPETVTKPIDSTTGATAPTLPAPPPSAPIAKGASGHEVKANAEQQAKNAIEFMEFKDKILSYELIAIPAEEKFRNCGFTGNSLYDRKAHKL